MLSFIRLTEWKKLWAELGLSPMRDAVHALIALSERYNEPHRFYHDNTHIAICLRMAAVLEPHLENPQRFKMAIALHDIVYDVTETGYPRNEEASADFARDFFRRYHGPVKTAEGIAQLILATKHRDVPTDHDARLLVDTDLWCGLGQPYELFVLNAQNIRQEFSHVPDVVFYGKNHGFLRSLLERPTIFSTPFFQERYEAQARSNLMRHLASQN